MLSKYPNFRRIKQNAPFPSKVDEAALSATNPSCWISCFELSLSKVTWGTCRLKHRQTEVRHFSVKLVSHSIAAVFKTLMRARQRPASLIIRVANIWLWPFGHVR
jgi:hypothetical protein